MMVDHINYMESRFGVKTVDLVLVLYASNVE